MACDAMAAPVFLALRMDSLVSAVVTGITAAGLFFLLYVAFVPRTKEEPPKTKKLRQCPTCKRWQEVS